MDVWSGKGGGGGGGAESEPRIEDVVKMQKQLSGWGRVGWVGGCESRIEVIVKIPKN